MDIHRFLQQQHHHHHRHHPSSSSSRYVPITSPRPHYPEPPTFSHHHSNNQSHHFPQPQPHPPPPPPPPPHPRPLPPLYHQRPLPPPPLPPLPQQQQQQQQRHPFTPTQSQSFSFSSPTTPPFFSHNQIDDRNRFRLPEPDHSRPEFFNPPPRVLTDSRPYHHLDLDRNGAQHHHHHNERTFDKFRLESGGNSSSRFVGPETIGYTFGSDPNHRDRERNELVWGGDHRRLNTSSRDLGFVSNQNQTLRKIESNSSGYDHRFGSVRENEGFRGGRIDAGHDRQTSRDGVGGSLYEIGDGDGDGDRARIGSGKREYFGSESGRYNSGRGNREGSSEYNRTPRKQIQKKSALLRLQVVKTNHRNRESEHEPSHYSGYFDKTNSGSFRGKDQFGYLSHGMEEEEEEEEVENERKGSPVELDVSFKSNSLVAKAIVTPPSSTVVSDMDLTPPNREKIRKMSDGDCSNSKMRKLNEGTVKLDSSTHVTSKASSTHVTSKASPSGKDSKHSGEKAMTYNVGNVCDGSSQPSSSRASVSLVKSKVERCSKDTVSDKDGTNVGSGKNTAPKVVKRKKIVKKIVRRVVNPQSRLSSSEQMKKCDQPVKSDSSTHGPPAASGSDKGVIPSEKIITSDGMASRQDVALQPSTAEVNLLPKNDLVSNECGINVDCNRACVPKIRRNWKGSTSPLGSPSCEENKIGKSPVNADNSTHILDSISNTDNDVIKPLKEITFSDIDIVEDVSKQICHNGVSLSHRNGAEKDSTGAMLSLENNFNSGLLSSEEIKTQEEITNTYSSHNGTDKNLGFEIGMVKSQGNITVCDVGIMDAIRKQPCANQFTTSLENSIAEEIPGTRVGSSAIVGLSSSEETKIHQGLVHGQCSKRGSDITWDSDNGFTSLEEKITVLNGRTVNNTGKYPSTVKNCAIERSPSGVSVRASGGNTQKIKKRRKTRTQLDFSYSTDIHVEPVNDLVSPANAVNSTLCLSVKGPSPAEVTFSGVGSSNVALLPGQDGMSGIHAKSLTDGLSEVKFTNNVDVNGYLYGTSLRCENRREGSASDLAFRQTAYETNEGPTGTSTSCAEVPLSNNDDITQPDKEVAASSINNLCTSGLIPCPNGLTVLPKDTLDKGSLKAVRASWDVLTKDGLKLLQHGVESCIIAEDKAIPNAESPCISGLGSEPKEMSTLMACNINQNDIMDIERSGNEKMDAQAAEDRVLIDDESRCKITSEPQSADLDQRFSITDKEYDCPLVKEDLPSVSNKPSLFADGCRIFSSNTTDEVMESISGTHPTFVSPDTLSEVQNIHMLNARTSLSQISIEKVCGDDQKLDQKSIVEGGSHLSTHTSFAQCIKPVPVTEINHSTVGKTVLLPSQDSKITSHSLSVKTAELMGRKTQLGHAIPRTYPGHSSFVSTNSKNTASSTQIAKPRTWHRTGNSSAPLPGNKPFSQSVPPQRQLVKNNVKPQNTSYIRKGNSLVRKTAPVPAQRQGSHGLSSSVYRANSSGIDELKKSTGSDIRVDVTDAQNLLKTGTNTPFEKPGTPPLPNDTKLFIQTAVSSGDNTPSPFAERSVSDCFESTSDPMKFTETKNGPKTSEDDLKISEISENVTGSSNNLESLAELNGANLASSNMKRIVYVKRKSNQLVATSNPSDLSGHNGNKIQAASDGYYKRRKNQLIRASLENQSKQSVTIPDDLFNSEGQQAPTIVSSRKYSKKRLHKVVTKTREPMKSSLVWTLRGTQSSKNDQKVLPQLFPWKRATYCRNFMQNTAPISNNSSLSMISRKLLLLRRRDTVYTRSSNGFSLRKFKVLSVGGSSLKWSKSIEKYSKKANEEATLAVAAVEKKKREQYRAACSSSRTKNRNNSSRERIFRVGSVRYKMDSTKRTLQRISDEESTCSTAPQSEKDVKKSYIPRRLVIGNDEYVRIGNGNQLIRDPKKRARVLASEKVRWSLHTARLRLARKRKYCQFFTRFGKCNKDDGKCPYIHDPSKIAVCTKFLKGLCSNPNCKLTHKVIPERMPDCSYFLQGLCTNRNCPYRHVNVNPKASTCDGFLRGYCADGDECRKKHSYVCPVFEATGTCPQGSKCKLHHPKNRSKGSKGKKRKRGGQQRKAQGRYFGSTHVNVSEPRTAVNEKHSTQHNDDIFIEGKYADYISLEFSDEEVGETNDLTSERMFYDSDSSDLQLDDLDELIKPFRIMNRNTA
ncbi:hypothetical protein CMV_000424 [Castanea mollissima]|uniref:C3H1-type domain-containing protein n=1 Tax=Castanea mollissima TaxID=60419 RepID=A0A8J4RZB2_9ROSI|nr:hypothetical protein CMV_000424 [Castanea mollissima]